MKEQDLIAAGYERNIVGEWVKPCRKPINAALTGEALSTPDRSGAASISPPEFLGQKPSKDSPTLLRTQGAIESNERDMHRALESWCRINELSYIHSRMDRKSTIAEGWPDFTIIKRDRVCCVELKFGNGQLRMEQEQMIDELRSRGTPVFLTNNVAMAIAWVRVQLQLETK